MQFCELQEWNWTKACLYLLSCINKGQLSKQFDSHIDKLKNEQRGRKQERKLIFLCFESAFSFLDKEEVDEE